MRIKRFSGISVAVAIFFLVRVGARLTLDLALGDALYEGLVNTVELGKRGMTLPDAVVSMRGLLHDLLIAATACFAGATGLWLVLTGFHRPVGPLQARQLGVGVWLLLGLIGTAVTAGLCWWLASGEPLVQQTLLILLTAVPAGLGLPLLYWLPTLLATRATHAASVPLGSSLPLPYRRIFA